MRIKKLISGILSAAMCLSIMGGATASAELSEDKTLYSWRPDVNADNVWGGGLAKNGGTWDSAIYDVEFSQAESAICFNKTGYEYFSLDLGEEITKGEVNLSLDFKTNGAYFGVILDNGGGKDNSTAALTIDPWGEWNSGPVGKNLTGKIAYGKFPWGATKITESNELGQHKDDGFGAWLTAEISARPKTQKYDLCIKAQNGDVIRQTLGLDMKDSRINSIVFGFFHDMAWNAVTYVKNINVEYIAEWQEPTEDKNLYTYPTEPTEDNILSGGLEQNGGTYNGGVATEVEFNQTEGALTLNNDGVKDAGLYDYFNYNIGGAITKGQIDLGFKFKTNGAYFGIILDSGNGKSDSTPALTITPWGNTGSAQGLTGVIGYGKFPWGPPSIAESAELGQHSDNAFGAWLTAEISARPQDMKYSIVIKKENGSVLAQKSGLDMTGTQIQRIVFVQLDEMEWNAVTYVKDIKVDFSLVRPELKDTGIRFVDIKGNTPEKPIEINPALRSISLDFGTKDVVVSESDPIVIKDSGGGVIPLVGAVKDELFVIEDIPVLKENSEYWLIVPKSVATSDGNAMRGDYNLKFTTGVCDRTAALTGIFDGETKVTTLDAFKAANRVSANVEMINGGDSDIKYVLAVFCYNQNKMIYADAVFDTVAPGSVAKIPSIGIGENSELAAKLDSVTKVSVCLWNTLSDMIPYCESIEFGTQSENNTESVQSTELTAKINYSYKDNSLKISGTSPNRKAVAVQILKSGKTFDSALTAADILYGGQVKSNGRYGFDIGYDSSIQDGEYLMRVTSGDGKAKDFTLYIGTSEALESAYNALNTAAENNDSDGFRDVINTQRNKLNFAFGLTDSKTLGTELDNYMAYVKANPLNVGDEDKNTRIFKTFMTANGLNKNEINDIDSVIDEIYFADEKIKDYYAEFSDAQGATVYFTDKMKGKNIKTLADFENAAKESLILTTVKYQNGIDDIKNVLNAYGSVIGVTGSVSNNVLRKLAANGDYENGNALKEAIRELSNADSISGNSGSGSGSGSGGSGKGSGSGIPITGGTTPNGETVKTPITRSFDDIDGVAWASEAIHALADKNIINGKSDGVFAPDDFMTREEFAKILVIAMGLENESFIGGEFKDTVENEWYYKYVYIAKEHNIINGIGGGEFGIGHEISRQDMAVMIYRAIQSKTAADYGDAEPTFDDMGQISDYALDAVAALYKMGIVNGVSETEFAPLDGATRAQAAKIVYGVLDLIQ